MSRMARSGTRIPVGTGSAPLTQSLSASLAGLSGLRDRLPSAPVAAAPAAGKPVAAGVLAGATKLVLRRERKGHGGKTATRIEGLGGHPKDIDALAGDIRRAFGCGSAVDGSDVVVQGDQVERLKAWLEDRGARKVVVGN